MSKLRVVCHMMATLNGKIITENWGKGKQVKQYTRLYEKAHKTFDSDAWLCGRVTMEKDFADGVYPKQKGSARIAKEDFIADHKANSFAIAVDASGRLAWKNSSIDGDHIIEVLTEKVNGNYLKYLQGKGISYIFCGKSEIDFHMMLKKLGKLFPIKTLMLEGGGHLNGSLLNEGLIDELSLLLIPIADTTPGAQTVFELSEGLEKHPTRPFKLHKVKQKDDVIWLRYVKQDKG